MKRLLDYDPVSGQAEWFEFNGDTFTVATTQDVSPILERNKTAALDTGAKSKGIKECWWKVATVPNLVIERWLREHNVNFYKKEDWPKVQKLLNDPDYRYLRSSLGRL